MTSMDACVADRTDESVSPNSQLQFPIEEDTMDCFDNYRMTHKKRGVAVIFNNETFKNLDQRVGSTKDKEDFKNALIQLGFDSDDIKVYPDKTANEMDNIFNGFKDEYKDSDIDCFVCAILTHGGEEDMICGYEGQVKLDKLLSYLKPDHCPSLTEIPKLIFVQACRGSKMDLGIEQKDSQKIIPERSPKIPLTEDMLVCYSSCVECPAFRAKTEGSWFMQSLSGILEKYGDKYEIMKLLTAVNKKVAFFEYFNGCKQMPCIISTLRKALKFPPKN